MANTFTITITAVDKATAVVRSINRAFASFTAPIDKLNRSMKAFSKEAGLDRLGKSVTGVGKAAGAAGASLGRMITPLATIVGFAAGGSILGAAAAWARWGFGIRQTALDLGMATADVQRFHAAAGMMGMDAKGLDGALMGLGDTLEDALYGRNPETLSAMSQLGIALKRTKDGAIDTKAAFLDVADAVARHAGNPELQRKIAQMFGLGDALPLLRKGRAGVEEMFRRAQVAGAIATPAQIAAAEKMQLAMFQLKLEFVGIGNAVMQKLAPVIEPLVAKFSAWASANRGVIATRIVNFVVDLTHGILQLVRLVGGWKNALIGVALVMNAGTIANVVRLGLAVGRFGLVLGRVLLPVLFTLARVAIPMVAAAFDFLFVSTPVGWILLAVAAIAGAAYLVIKHWKPISAFFEKLWGDITRIFKGGWDVIAGIATLDMPRIITGMNEMWSGWLDGWHDTWKAAGDVFEWAWGHVKDLIDKLTGGRASQAAAAAAGAAPGLLLGNPAVAIAGAVAGWNAGALPLGLRLNNPGAMRSWGNLPTEQGFVHFPSMTAGLAAMGRQLQAYQTRHGLSTIAGILNRWAPPSENDTAGYVRAVTKATGWAADQRLNLSDPQTLARLEAAMIAHEQGRNPFSQDQILQAIGGGRGETPVKVDLRVHGLPAGTKATSTVSTPSQVKVSHGLAGAA